MTLPTAGALTDPQLPAIASKVYTTYARPESVDLVPHPQTKIVATPVGQIWGQHDLAEDSTRQANLVIPSVDG